MKKAVGSHGVATLQQCLKILTDLLTKGSVIASDQPVPYVESTLNCTNKGSSMDLCKSCVHYKDFGPGKYPALPICKHESAICALDNVWGYDIHYTAQAMRKSVDPAVCGPKAKHYKAIE